MRIEGSEGRVWESGRRALRSPACSRFRSPVSGIRELEEMAGFGAGFGEGGQTDRHIHTHTYTQGAGGLGGETGLLDRELKFSLPLVFRTPQHPLCEHLIQAPH